MVGICVDLKRLDNLGSTPVSEKQLKAIIPFLLQLKVLFKLSFQTILLMDTHRENALTNKTQTLTKNINMDIWVIITFN